MSKAEEFYQNCFAIHPGTYVVPVRRITDKPTSRSRITDNPASQPSGRALSVFAGTIDTGFVVVRLCGIVNQDMIGS
jgi:hypothetical protein